MVVVVAVVVAVVVRVVMNHWWWIGMNENQDSEEVMKLGFEMED